MRGGRAPSSEGRSKAPRTSATAHRHRLVWVSGGRKWVLGSSKVVNAACLAVFDVSILALTALYIGNHNPSKMIYAVI